MRKKTTALFLTKQSTKNKYYRPKLTTTMNYRFGTWVRQLKNVAGLIRFSTQVVNPPIFVDSGVTDQHKIHQYKKYTPQKIDIQFKNTTS